MPRKPKAKNTLSAGQRVALDEQKRREAQMSAEQTPSEQISERLTDVPNIAVESTASEPKTSVTREKPQSATVKVDLSVAAGELPPLHGMCNGPVSIGADISHLFMRMGTPWVRFDKTDGTRSGYVVDISKVFPDMNADERSPESYRFKETDKYILAAKNLGAGIIFRLGESFDGDTPEHLLRLYGDADKLAVICVNIIKHYNNYFCGGFALGIDYFEILSGIDHPAVLEKSSAESIYSLYAKIANSIKIYDDTLKVGGMGFSSCSTLCREFVRYCARRRVPLDFLSVTAFFSDPEDMGEELEKYVRLMKNSAYSRSEIIVGQWGYIPRLDGVRYPERIMNGTDPERAEQRRQLFAAQSDVRGAAYAAAGLLKMLEYPDITKAFFYDAQPTCSRWCSVCDSFGIERKPFYAFRTYNDLLSSKQGVYCVCERDPKYAHSGIYAAASMGEREAYVMIACFDSCPTVDLRLDNIPDSFYTADIYMLDGVKDMSLCSSIQISGLKKRLVLSTGSYGIVLIKLY